MSESILEQSKKARGSGKYIFTKKRLVILVLLLVGGYYAYGYFYGDKGGVSTVVAKKEWTVSQGDIKISVDADGKVVAEDGVDLTFSSTDEVVEEIYVAEGDFVKQGDKIARISTTSMEFDLQNAQDSYQAALLSLADGKAGASEKDIKNSQYQIEQAESSLAQTKTSLEQTKIDADEKVEDAEEAIETAQENLKMNSGGNSEIVDDAYSNLYSNIENLSITVKNHLYSADKILGIDDAGLNDNFEGVLGALNSSTLYSSKSSYIKTRDEREELDDMLSSVDKSDYGEMDELADQASLVAESAKDMFLNVQNLLDATITSTDFSQSSLDNFKSSAASSRSSINNTISSLDSSIDAIENAADSVSDLQTSYDKAVSNLADIKRQNVIDIANAETSVRNKEISLDQAKLSYEDLIAPLTTSELQNLTMKVNQAKNSLSEVQDKIDEATLTTPIDGQVAALNGKVGEIITAKSNEEAFASIINKDTLFVEVNIEEGDVSEISKGQKAYATFEALDGVEAEGEVTFISMSSNTNTGGVVTYAVRIVLTNVEDTQVREGMTSSVSFVTSEAIDVLIVPVAAVKNMNGVASVQMENGEWQEVVTGFTDGDLVEVISGLKKGDKISY
ncbi:MAG: efflux RND transporter periplasmic adaptor subunit [Candidatus Paceibacterota bacterium]